ncbi:MAG TPA: condensation domain-containing protein, partial [Telluria sp.]|nr:condensation domain-containing protein [Telluria sp.]
MTASSLPPDRDDSLSVAIIGMAGRFPGAADIEQFWRNLRDGVEGMRRVDSASAAPGFVNVVSSMDGIDQFDAGFFGVTPRDAAIMDPQQRHFLECAWEALEHAGYDPLAVPGSVGVYGGAGINTYLLENLYGSAGIRASVAPMQLVIGNQTDFLCTRVAHQFNLRGPAVVVQSACSTSLVAVHMACQALLNGECDMALAGGVAINVLNMDGYQHTEGSIFSRDGHCRPFDADASGTVAGNGAGIVVLKPLARALEDGDTIHAVIRGSAINNDGSDKIGFTAPSVAGQAAAIAEAHAVAGVTGEDISYIEAHGTGTKLGDPIEIQALQQAFSASTSERGFCAIGSVKSNFGHLDAAAGVAGLIKTTLALKHRQIPPSLHFATPNPHIDFSSTAFHVNAALRSWPERGGTRLAGVSSFGIGGTNAHVVVEEYPRPEAVTEQGPELLVLSARSPVAARNQAERLRGHLEGLNLADAAYTLRVGRHTFDWRIAVACDDAAAAADALRAARPVQRRSSGPAPVAFMFPGQGAQYVNMARGLYEREAAFRAALDECIAGLDCGLRDILFPPAGQEVQAADTLSRTEWTQPALFSVEYALARQFMHWGVQPSALVGHSLGEYVAACISGVFALPDALRLVAARGRLVAGLPRGSMLAVQLPESEVSPFLGDGLCLAGVNGPQACTLSGETTRLAELQSVLEARGVACQVLATSHAFHSSMLDPVLPEFRTLLQSVPMRAPSIPYLSNLTGDWITPEQATSPEYWVNHLRGTVRFGECVDRLLDVDGLLMLELGPGAALSNLVRRTRREHGKNALNVLPHRLATDCPLRTCLQALGDLWCAGADVDLSVLDTAPRRRIPLPTYAFEHARYWVDGARTMHQEAGESAAEPVLQQHHRSEGLGQYEPAANASESAIATLWEELLGIAPIGRNDNFFEMGGDSLLATQAVSRLREVLGVEFPLNAFFEASSLAAIAERASNAMAATQLPALEQVDRDSALVLSFAQQRLWFLDQLEPGSPLYNIPVAVRLRGKLDVSAFRSALNEVVRRHEALRTTFASVDGTPVQVIAPELVLPLEETDLSGLPPAEREARALWLGQDEAQSPFDLTTGPLVRARLIKLAKDEHIAVLNAHHIVSDGWSMGVLVREMGALYAAFAEGKASPLAPLPVQYADFAHWQRQWLSGATLQNQLDYWKEQLSGAPALLALPTDRPRPAMQSYRGTISTFEIPAETLAGLHALGAREQATLFMTIAAAFNILLARYSGQSDVCIGTAIANRNRAETEDLIGFFVNTLVLRTQVDGSQTFADLLRAVRATALAAYAHQDVPFEQLVEVLRPQRQLSYAPLFQVMLVLQNAPLEMRLPGLVLEPVNGDSGTSKFDLTLNLAEQGGKLVGTIEYSTDLFDASTIERMARHFTNLLAAAAETPEKRVDSLPMLDPSELST